VSLGFTKNLGNFESLRIDIGLDQEGVGHPDKTFEKVYEWVSDKLVEKVAEIEEEVKS
jgi:hypothetical protein